MEPQTNPYLIWQLIPGIVLFGIAMYIQSRPLKKRESGAFTWMMLAGSLWAITNAIQLATPNPGWQRFWHNLTYLGIMIIPTAWLLLSVKITGIFREPVEKYERIFYIFPAITYLIMLTNDWHDLFFTSSEVVDVGGYAALQSTYGVLFYVHTGYSYLILLLGLGILSYSLVTEFKKYGFQAYGLLVGTLAPLIGNAYFLFGSPPPGFPDPTPIIFSATGIAFAWAIFGGQILEVVPLAHETIVRKLSTGILILDADKNIRDINEKARKMLGLAAKTYAGDSMATLVAQHRDVARVVNQALEASVQEDQTFQIDYPATGRTFDVHVSHIGGGSDGATGWLIQFNDISEQKQAEENLESTQKAMRSVLDTLQDSFFEADPRGIITYANKAFIRNLGYTRWEDVQGKNFRTFTDRKTVREIFKKFNELYETKQPLKPFEYHYRTKDGRVFVGETTVSPIMQGGRVIGSRGLIRDITTRYIAEKEILQQKDLLDNLLQQSPIAMVINDKMNRITMVNPAFEKLFGFTREEVLGGTLDDFLPSLELDPASKMSNSSVMKLTAHVTKRKAKDGRILDVEIFNKPFHVGGERFGYLAFYNDITERLKTQSELEKSQSSYIAVLETLQDAYFEADPSGRLTYVNEAFCNAVSYPKERLIGWHFRNVASRKSVRATFDNFKKLYETGKPIPHFDFIYRGMDNQERQSEMVVSPILDNGVVVGARGLIRDITVRIEAEEILRQAKEAAESRAGELSAINRVAATVGRSLDLKEILQSVTRELTSIFNIRNAGIGLLSLDKKSMEIVAFHAVDPDEKSALGLLLPVEGNTSSMEVIRTKKTIIIQDAQSDPRTSSISDISRSRGTKSIMIVPLLARGEAIGTIGMPAKDPSHQFSRNEIELAETIASQIATAIDNARLYSRTETALGVAERDLEIGRQIQSGFFPETLPHLPGWEIATHFHAARQVAGDFYDVFQFKNSKFTAFIIADVCDKGVGAALFMVLFRSLLRAFSERQVDQGNVRAQLLEIIQNTNNFIAQYHGKSNMFATLFFGILDPDRNSLVYVNGGHEAPVVLNKDGQVIQRLMPTGPAVGMFVDMDFQVEQVHFNEGDFLVGFTDGTTDAKNAAGQQFTEDRLLQSISVPWTSIFSMLFELNIELKRHIGEQNQFDDITLITFRRKNTSENEQHAICRPADINILGELREFVEAATEHCRLPAEDGFAFKLAVDELCANIIQYGYEDREPGMLSLLFETRQDTARLVIRDDGTFFAPEQAKTPDVEAGWDERQIGGLGIYFVQELMDNVTYNTDGNGVNQFILEKKIPGLQQPK